MLELLEPRETPNSLYNPLFASDFLALDTLDAPYAIVPGDGSDSGSAGGGTTQGGSTGGTGTTQPPPDNFTPADPAAAAATVSQNANQFDSTLNTDDANFAAMVAAAAGGQGQSSGSPAVGAAVVIGLATPSAAPTSPTPPADAPTGPAPALAPPPGAPPAVGVGLSPSQFQLDPFPLLRGATVSALTPFVVSAGMSVPAATSNGGTTVTTGADANGIGYTTTATDSYTFGASLAQDSAGGQTYEETYSFTYDVQTVPASTGGASVHDWGASGYTFIANNDNGQYSFTLTAALTADEVGSQTQTATAADGSTNTTTTTWQSESQYDRTITDTTNAATGAASGTDSGGGVTTQSASSAGTYRRPVTVGFGAGTVTGSSTSYSGQGTSYQFAVQESRDATGAITQGGTWADASGGYSGDWYSGSGTYAVSAAYSGGTSSSATTPASADPTPSPSASGGPNAPGGILTGGGTYAEFGADSMGYGSSDQYTLGNDGTWQASSGVGSSSGTGWTQTSYSGSGGYNYLIDGGSVSGAWQESGGAETSYSDTTNSTLSGDGWSQTGTSSSGDAGGQNASYQGSGSYVIESATAAGSGSGSGSSSASPPAVSASPVPSVTGDGPNTPGAAFWGGGSVTESGSDASGYADNTTSALASDGLWQPTGGSDWSSASGSASWSYSASGGYGYAIAGGAVSGTWGQSGSDSTSYSDDINSTLTGDGWAATGSSTSGDAGGQYDSYKGSGNYIINSDPAAGDSTGAVPPPAVSASPVPSETGGGPNAPGAVFSGSGSVAESGSDASGYGDSSASSLGPDGSWQPTGGSDWTSASGSASWSYSASGGYGYAIAGGAVSGTWGQSGSDNTGYQLNSEHTPAIGDASETNSGSQSTTEEGGQHSWYSGSGSYEIGATNSTGIGSGDATLSGSGGVAEGGVDDWSYDYSVQSVMGSDGMWQPGVGSGSSTEIGVESWDYSAAGVYTRPLDGGTLSGTWQANGAASDGYNAQTESTLNPDGTWTTTGVASSSGSGGGLWAYSGSGSYSSSSSTGDSLNGSQSSFDSQAKEHYSEGWSSQYTVLSTLAATGLVTTVTIAAASGSASGSHTYSSSGAYSSWSQTGNYAEGNGTSGGTTGSSGLSLSESMQSLWQENYVIREDPTGTTTTGGASGSGEASGSASWYTNGSGYSESDSSGSGYSYASGNSWSSGASGQDNYDDQTSWSEPWNLVGASSSGSSSGTTVDHVWGSETTTWSSGSWWSSHGYGSGSGSGGGSGSSSGSSISTGGSGSSSYDLYVNYPGFYQGGSGYSGRPVAGTDAAWAWGQGWTGQNGPLGPAAYSGLGYAFAPGDPVSVADPGLQTNYEGDQVNLQVQPTDWATGNGASSGSGSGGLAMYTAVGLPGGLSIDPVTGLISGVIASGDALYSPYIVTATYTDGAGNSASTTFEWAVDDPLTVAYPGDQSGAEGQPVSLQMQAGGYGSGGTGGTFDATGLPPGLSIDPNTGLISGTLAVGDAAGGPYFVSVRYTNAAGDDAGTNFSWFVSDPVTLTDLGTQSVTEGAAVSLQIPSDDANYSPRTYSATDLPPGLTINPSTGLISGKIAAGDASAGDDSAGTYSATVMATDGNGSFAAEMVEWDVALAVTFTDPGDQASTEGAAVSVAVPATDPLGAVSYRATGLPPGLGIDPNTGVITGAAAAGAAANGPYTVTVTASDGTYSGSTTFAWNVAAGPVSLTDPEQQSSIEGDAVSLQIHANGAALLYTATGLPDGLSLNPTSGLIGGTIAAGDAANGPYFVTVTAWGAGGASASQSFGWDVASPVTVTAIADQSGAEGDAVNLQVGGTDQYGVLSYSAAGLPPGLGISSAGLISGSIAAGSAAGGPYLVTVTATDGTYSGSQTFTWQVAAPAAPDSPPYQPTPTAPDDGPWDWSARDFALASFAEPGPNGFGDAADAPSRVDAVFSELVGGPGGGLTQADLPALGDAVFGAPVEWPSGGDVMLLAAGGGFRPGRYVSPPRRPSGPSPAAVWLAGVSAALPQVTDPNALQWARDHGLIIGQAQNLIWPQHSWSEWKTHTDGREHLFVYAADWTTVPDAAGYMAWEIKMRYEKAGSPAVTLGADLADIAAAREIQKQAAEDAATLKQRPADVIEGLVQEGKAFQRGNYVYIATVAGDSLVMLVYRAYLPSSNARLPNGEIPPWSSLEFGTWLPDHPDQPDLGPTTFPFRLVLCQRIQLGPQADVADQLKLKQNRETAEQYISLARGQADLNQMNLNAAALAFALHEVPFGAAADHFTSEGVTSWEGYLSLLGDVAMFAGGPLAASAGEGTALAKGLTITAIAADTTLGVARGSQAIFAFQEKDNAKAAGYLGEAMLRLLGASVTAVGQLKSVAAAGKAVHNTEELVEEANTALGDLRNVKVNCFPLDAPVAAEGGPRAIGRVGAGDRVWAFDFHSGQWRLCAVEGRQEAEYDGPMVTLRVGLGTLEATAYHPFWVVEGAELEERPRLRSLDPNDSRGLALAGRWVYSHDLREGDVLQLLTGERAAVRAVAVRHVRTRVGNLTVSGLHTFAVGAAGVLVHNASDSETKWLEFIKRNEGKFHSTEEALEAFKTEQAALAQAAAASQRAIDAQDVAVLVDDSNKEFPLTVANAQEALTPPPGTARTVVAGPGVEGADISFYGPDGSPILKREVKSVYGGYNSFNRDVSRAAGQLRGSGEVWVQVKPGTDIATWLKKFRGTPNRDFDKYAGVVLRVFDDAGKVIYSGPIK